MKKTLLSLLAVIIIFTSTGPVLANNITIDMPYSIYESVEKNVIFLWSSLRKNNAI